MNELFETLTRAAEGSAAVAFSSAIAWGVLSVVLSPCHLSSIPLIVAFIGQRQQSAPRQAFLTATFFSMGILVTIAVLGGITAALGRMLGDLGPYGNYAIALVFLILGLHFLGILPLPFSGGGPRDVGRKGYVAAFVLGLIFGVGVGPCTFAFMAPMMGVALKVAGERWLYGGLLLLAYGVGHCAVIIAAGTSAGWVQRVLNWNESSRGAVWMRRVCGILILLAGLYLVYVA